MRLTWTRQLGYLRQISLFVPPFMTVTKWQCGEVGVIAEWALMICTPILGVWFR
jgi:hypothetical protein